MDIQPLYEEFAMSKFAHSADRYDSLLTEIASLRQQLAEQTSAEPYAWYREMPMEYAGNCIEHINEKGEAVYVDFRMSTPPENKGWIPLYRQAPSVDVLVEALRNSMTAIDDWLNTYAPEFCDTKRVAEARQRINANGALAYITDVQEKNRIALSSYKPTEG
jgi:DNA modification methylase